MSIPECCKPDFVSPKAVRPFIYPASGIPAEARCGIPEIIRRAARSPILPCTRLGLSCLHCYRWSGELLPPLFTLTPRQARGGLFSVTLSVTQGFPCAPLLSQGVLPYGVRTFLSFLQTSERPHSGIDPDMLTAQEALTSGNFRSIYNRRRKSMTQILTNLALHL